jgi:hypothetical protein
MEYTLKQFAAMGLPPDKVEMVKKAKANWRREQSRARVKVRNAAPDAKREAVADFIPLLSSEKRPRELLNLIANDPPEVFWPIFLTQWSSCDAGWQYQERLAQIFRRVGPCPADVYALCNDAKFFANLPEQLTIYRGGDRSRIEAGISWTTEREIALGFASGHRGICPKSPVIATATICKADIFAAINDRDEAEIICLPKIEKVEETDKQRPPQ